MGKVVVRVAYAGPLAEAGKPAAGGYAAANLRTILQLRARGVEVLEIRYPAGGLGFWGYAVGFLTVFWGLFKGREGYDILHITPLRRHFVVVEVLLLSMVRVFGKRVFLDVRAGTFILNYTRRGAFYRFWIRRMLDLADAVGVEGEVYMDFLVGLGVARARILYFPNYVVWDETVMGAARTLGQGETFNMIYVGRMVPEKGVETALDVVRDVAGRGERVLMTFVGSGEPSYMKKLQNLADGLPVVFAGSLNDAGLASLLAVQHLFIFATRHEGEGHANALTEAMSFGVVPLCSEQGFNASVVGDAGVVLPVTAPADDYATSALRVRDNWAALSAAAAGRVRARFTERVLDDLMDAYVKSGFS